MPCSSVFFKKQEEQIKSNQNMFYEKSSVLNKAQDDNCNVEKSKHKSSKVQKTITGLFQTTLVLEASELAASSNFRNTK